MTHQFVINCVLYSIKGIAENKINAQEVNPAELSQQQVKVNLLRKHTQIILHCNLSMFRHMSLLFS